MCIGVLRVRVCVHVRVRVRLRVRVCEPFWMMEMDGIKPNCLFYLEVLQWVRVFSGLGLVV